MADYYYRKVNMRFGPAGITPAVRNLLIANVSVFALQIASTHIRITPDGGFFDFDKVFGLMPQLVFHGWVWQIGTYMFLHAEPMHIFMNLFFIWMFGVDVERTLGTKKFTALYFISGIGAGILTCAFPPFWNSQVIGASGAAFGIMVAFGMLFPDRMVLLFFVIPVRAIYMVIFMIGIEVAYMMFMMGDRHIAHIAHVSGALCGYLYLKYGGRFLPAAGGIKKKSAPPRPALSDVEEQKKVDEILDKINREGLHKLSRAERLFLQKRAQRRK